MTADVIMSPLCTPTEGECAAGQTRHVHPKLG